MPRTRLTATPSLEILLNGAQTTYNAGDTISGRVVRTAPLVSSQARVSIQLNGRTKSKMVVSRGQAGTSIYRGRFSLFNSDANRQQLSDGPIHIAPDGDKQEWAFTITIPSAPDPASVIAQNHQKFSYLPLGQRDIAAHTLPPVFFATGVFINTTYECFVEYFLEAKLHVEAAGGSGKEDRATVPLNILLPTTPDLADDFELVQRSFLCRISTYRFLQGSESGSLSLGQRTRELFGSSKVPQLVSSLQVEHPTVLQVGNPNNIPFRLLILPEPLQTTESIRDTKQTITLTGMTFGIIASTKLMCAGTLSPHTSSQTRKFGFDLKAAIEKRGEPIVLPVGEKAQPLDVSELLGINITSAIPLSHRPFGGRYKGQLYPSFDTYNIKHSHKLKWTLTVTAAGESTEISNEADITLLPGRGGEWHQSPEEDLPAYEEVPETPTSPLTGGKE
ncbi:uncharacterized protein DNG_06278 [Cephalotrichum gorgonifer]|uniref:Arrestin-like N-terminal domain-containing protein n=1 Tax=Cephalotrichum gorgonifer TaxID=2041049 RepID=A0AAE8N2E2_9PEZI|nr:uncharacterized protein DNG_06278 [Cephalotrichum gorgonifer]